MLTNLHMNDILPEHVDDTDLLSGFDSPASIENAERDVVATQLRSVLRDAIIVLASNNDDVRHILVMIQVRNEE